MDLRRRLQQLLPTTEARSEGCLWRASLPPQQVRRARGQVASALEYLHGLGLVHADLKPATILTTTMPCPLVADADAPASAQSCGLNALFSDLDSILPALRCHIMDAVVMMCML